MPEYEPLDLSSACNAGLELYESLGHRRPESDAGERSSLGIPFRIAAAANCFLTVGPASRAGVAPAVPVGRTARRLLFAHVLLDSRLHQGDPPGRVAGRYSVVWRDGERCELAIRERFETGVVPVGWGELPFLAVPDRPDALWERYSGPWGAAGNRQTETTQSWPSRYYFWDWENPRPDVPIERIEFGPGDAADDGWRPTLIVAAITLGHLEEEPFNRDAAVPVKLTLARADDIAPRFGLAVEVDRGVATYPYALPEQSAEEFLSDPRRGWGETQNEGNSPAYTEIAAAPSATVKVRKGDEVLGEARWGDVRAKGAVDTGRVRIEVVDTGRNWIHTTVLDDETGRPIPCRAHFRTPDGIPYAPHGHHAHVNSNLGTWHIDVGGDVRLDQISYAYIDGRCQGWLPRGELIVDVARGYEYEPLRERVEIRPGQRELTLRLRRTRNLNAERYFSGDTHVHFLSSQGALTEAAGEDLDVVNLLQSQWGHLYTNAEEFTGRPVASGDGATIVYATQENRQHMLGHLTLLGLKEPVMPWCSDGPGEAELGGNLETTLSHWADACHAQGGTVVIPHLPNPNGEPAALIATGRADAVEMLVHNPFFHLEYYRYLNGGYRLPLAGGTDKMDSGVPVGLYRTYAYIPHDQEFTYDNWCRALRSGNTFLSGGPLLSLTVDGHPIGSTITLGTEGGTVEVDAVATSIFPVHTLELVQGGRVVASTEESQGARELRLRATLRIDGPTWLCARCAGPGYTSIPHHDSWHRGIMGHTSPVYIACGRAYDLFQPDTAYYMLTLVDGSLQHMRRRARQWPAGSVTHHHSHEDHQEFLEGPFHEAAAALHRKLHEHGIEH